MKKGKKLREGTKQARKCKERKITGMEVREGKGGEGRPMKVVTGKLLVKGLEYMYSLRERERERERERGKNQTEGGWREV